MAATNFSLKKKLIELISEYKDSEYDFDFYEDLSTDYSAKLGYTGQNNYYVVEALDNKKNQHDSYLSSNDYPISLEKDVNSHQRRDPSNKRFSWFKSSEKIYRYTKHRIPGYDYDEFDYMRSSRKCDDKSIWTHCLCQFTCSKPDVVDCYAPCKSGCECREEYVFDEKTQRCLLPEHCSPDNDYEYRI